VGYGQGAEVRYYPIDYSNNKMLSGICQGGAKEGDYCTEDANCIDESSEFSTGRCVLLNQISSMYGWPGYCVEKDSSIQIWGSRDAENRACLTWLPVDQLKGSTDLYGKSFGAGYPIEDTYYCSEVGIYSDLYPTGAVFDSKGMVGGIDPACATIRYGTGCNYNEKDVDKGYHYCFDNAYCPKGYIALVSQCDTDPNEEYYPDEGGEGIVCQNTESTGDDIGKILPQFQSSHDACPYFCIPENSFHIQGEEIGEPCIINSYSDSGVSVFGTQYYLRNDLFDWVEEYKDCAVRGIPVTEDEDYIGDWYDDDVFSGWSSGGYGFTSLGDLLEEEDVDGNKKAFSQGAYGVAYRPMGAKISTCNNTGLACSETEDCEIVEELDAFCDAFCSGVGVYATVITGPAGILAGATCYPYCKIIYNNIQNLKVEPECVTSIVDSNESFALQNYLGCYEIVQATTDDMDDANKAWTNRLLIGDYETTSDVTDAGGTEFEYSASTLATPAGRALFEEYYEVKDKEESLSSMRGEWGGIDAWPLPVLAYDTSSCDGSNEPGASGLATTPMSRCDDGSCSKLKYPNEGQWLELDGSSFLTEGDDPWDLAKPYEDLDKKDEYDNPPDPSDYDDFGNSDQGNRESIKDLLAQLFGKFYKTWTYNWDKTVTEDDLGHGAYELVSEEDVGIDITAHGDPHGSIKADKFPNVGERAPVVKALGDCTDMFCAEGEEGNFSIDGVVPGQDKTGSRSVSVDLSFFTYASANQMPIKKIIVDWGDGDYTNSPMDWPTDNQSGSPTDDNFYENHRGLKDVHKKETYCDDDDEWGKTSESCDESYLTFMYDYVCNNEMVKDLLEKDPSGKDRVCVPNEEDRGQLTNSPCVEDGKCVFQPRVYVEDNWGWCTGVCTRGPDGTEECYDASHDGDDSINECNFSECPGGEGCDSDSSTIIDPWVYYQGKIIVSPE
jgi:hypothetical protein